jgi:predicted O-methyltransferase YrrM
VQTELMRFLRHRIGMIGGTVRRPPLASADPAFVLKVLDEPFRSALLSMYLNDPQPAAGGKLCDIDEHTRIPAADGVWMYELYLRLRPVASLEIGMAYGFSTLFFLAALMKNATGTHTAIDPFQFPSWHGVGMEKVRQVNGREVFRLIEDVDINAATDLTRDKKTFDFIFIDGNHRYDDVLVDFTLFAPLLNKGGCIIFDDLWLPSVRTALSFVQANRQDFKQISSPSHIGAFERIGDDARSWEHFVPFTVAPG